MIRSLEFLLSSKGLVINSTDTFLHTTNYVLAEDLLPVFEEALVSDITIRTQALTKLSSTVIQYQIQEEEAEEIDNGSSSYATFYSSYTTICKFPTGMKRADKIEKLYDHILSDILIFTGVNL